jgi:hypothetical protein
MRWKIVIKHLIRHFVPPSSTPLRFAAGIPLCFRGRLDILIFDKSIQLDETEVESISRGAVCGASGR